jgi:hypothetical protein
LVKRSVLRWELVGIGVIFIAGSLFHFLFEWAGGWSPVGVIAAVNESVWEHFKIAFWPALIYAIIEYPFLKNSVHNFFIAKAIGIYIMPAVIAIIFYAYTAIWGEEILAVDITIFFVAVALGQLASYKILSLKQWPKWTGVFGVVMVVLLAAAFGIFTFYPPHLGIFRDAVSGGYGIIP